MKKQTCLIALLYPFFVNAQNVGIGINTPLQKLHVNGGNFVITQTLAQTNTIPTVVQTYTIVNAGVLNYTASDSTGKIFDPGGPSGNYIANLNAYVSIPPVANCVGFEVTINSIGLGNGDSLIISDLPNWQNVHLAVGNNYYTSGSYVFNTSRLYLTFKSNNDGIVGSGFELVFKRKFDAVAPVPVSNLAGNVFLYDPKYSKLQIGGYKKSELLGINSISSGSSRASGSNSTAIGLNNLASGEGSTAFGLFNQVFGESSFVLGSSNILTSSTSVMAGFNNAAYSNGMTFIFGRDHYWSDNSNTTPVFIIGERSNSIGGDDPLFIVGNGDGPGFRGNAFEIDRTGRTTINGFTQLGKAAEGAPAIKTKKIINYNMPTTDNSWTFIPSGLTDMSKILSLQVIVTAGAYQFIPNDTYVNQRFRTNTDGTNIAVGTYSGFSTGLYGMPIKVFITYEE